MGIQRIRSIKPEFFVHEELAQLSFTCRLVFIGLWTVADREGRLEDRPARLKALLCPYDAVNMEQVLAELAGQHFICRYEVDGARYIDIPTFSKHQRPNHREAPSTYPVCPALHVHARVCPGTPGQDEAEREREREREGKGTGRSRSLRSLDVDWPGFEEFYTAYPRHEARKAALRAWNTLQPDEALRAALQAALRWQRQLPQWLEGKAPHPATYLNEKRYTDEPPTRLLFGTTARTAGNAAAIARGLEIATHGAK